MFFCDSLYNFLSCVQVGVQTEVEPSASATDLEEKVNAVLPLQQKDESS